MAGKTISTCLKCGAEGHSNLECPVCRENWLHQYKSIKDKTMSVIRAIYFVAAVTIYLLQPPFWHYAVGFVLALMFINYCIEVNNSEQPPS